MPVATASAAITATPYGTTFGAVVEGVDFDDLSEDTLQRIHDLLLEHQVIFFRQCYITPDQQETLARAFGTPSVYPVTRAVNPDSEDLPFMSEIHDSEEDPPNADGWHTDITWIPEPPKIGILSAIEIPETGGDTLWADIYHAYDELSPKMQEICESLTILHEVSPTILNATYNRGGDEAVRFVREHFPPVPHPLVRTHPETGRKALFVAGGFMIAVEGMSEEESKMFLDWLNSYISNPNFHLRWSWTEGDLAIWDERCTNHRALSNHYPQNRRMRRCTVDGDAPYLQLVN